MTRPAHAKPPGIMFPEDRTNMGRLGIIDDALTYRELIELTTHWLWEMDENFVCTYMSPKVVESLGYAPDELIGKQSFEFMTPEEILRITPLIVPVLENHEPFAFLENRLIHKDGHEVIVETSGVPVFDAGGLFKGYRGVDRDISNQKALENELLEKTESLKEANTALRVLLDYRAELAMEMEQRFGTAIRQLVLPYVTKLKNSADGGLHTTLLLILEKNLTDILNPLTPAANTGFAHLTDAEIRIADLVRNGVTTHDIAGILCISPRTVEVHRHNIRKKLKLGKTNLRSYLMTTPNL